MQEPIVFNARYLSTWTPDRLYRVYLRDKTLYFIRIGGQGGLDAAMASQFGLLGYLFWSRTQKSKESKHTELVDSLDRQHPQALLPEHKHNFMLRPLDIDVTSLEPPSKMHSHGQHVGRWLLARRGEKTRSYQFESLDDMHVAVQHLPTCLGRALRVNVVWNDDPGAYVRA